MERILVSHPLCPYVQRAAIVLMEKGAAFTRRDIDLAHKPDWFLAVSPLGKTPVLLVDGEAVFESAVICEYLEDTVAPALHPSDPLERARHRGWVEFASSVLARIAGFYAAPDAQAFEANRAELRRKFAQVEAVLPAVGPWFSGDSFCLVDAAFAPVFRYFDVFEAAGVGGFFDGMPKVQAWRSALAGRASVRSAVAPEYPQLLRRFLLQRNSELSRHLQGTVPMA